MAVYGVDVHDGYQQGLNFGTLYQQGYRFAAVKLTEGTGYVRDRAPTWIRAARAAGLIPGAYHWLTSSPGDAQARWFWTNLRAAGGPDGMLIQLDCEDNADWSDVQSWATQWRALSGNYPFLIYTGSWWWRPRGWPGNTVTPYLWDSHYLTADSDSVPDDPAALAAKIPPTWWTPGYGGWATATLIQFTSRGDAGALANNVDLNVYRGSIDQLCDALVRPLVDGLGEDMTPEEHNHLIAMGKRVRAGVLRGDPVLDDLPGEGAAQPVWIVQTLNKLVADVAALKARPPVNLDPVALTAALTAAVVAHPEILGDALQQLATAVVGKMPPQQTSGTWQADDTATPTG